MQNTSSFKSDHNCVKFTRTKQNNNRIAPREADIKAYSRQFQPGN